MQRVSNPRGVMAFHVSSRFFDLAPVLARIAADRQRSVTYGVIRTCRPSERDLGQLAHTAPRWTRLLANADDPLWTDTYTNVLGALQ